MLIAVEFTKGGRRYQYAAPDEFQVEPGDVVETPRADAWGAREATVVSTVATRSYPLDRTKGIVRVIKRYRDRRVPVALELRTDHAEALLKLARATPGPRDETANAALEALKLALTQALK